jgi:hypothetical protein
MYAHFLKSAVKRRRLPWSEVKPQLDAFVERSGGSVHEVEYWSLWAGLRDRIVRRPERQRTTTYYELPRSFFEN